MVAIGKVFVVDSTFLVGRALGRGESQYWPSNCIGVGILVHGVVRGLFGIWSCGCCG